MSYPDRAEGLVNIYFIENNRLVCLLIMVSVFVNSAGDRGSIPARVIPKTQEIVLA